MSYTGGGARSCSVRGTWTHSSSEGPSVTHRAGDTLIFSRQRVRRLWPQMPTPGGEGLAQVQGHTPSTPGPQGCRSMPRHTGQTAKDTHVRPSVVFVTMVAEAEMPIKGHCSAKPRWLPGGGVRLREGMGTASGMTGRTRVL